LDSGLLGSAYWERGKRIFRLLDKWTAPKSRVGVGKRKKVTISDYAKGGVLEGPSGNLEKMFRGDLSRSSMGLDGNGKQDPNSLTGGTQIAAEYCSCYLWGSVP